MEIYIGAENIISPLGNTAESNFNALLQGRSGVKECISKGFNQENLFLSLFDREQVFADLIIEGIRKTVSGLDADIIDSDDTLLIISSTKGDVQNSLKNPFIPSVEKIQNTFQLKNKPLIVSNACISGVLAINIAADYINSQYYKHIIVMGCDVASAFVLYGFQALYAISDAVCQPFDKSRKGINLGEACAGVVLSNEIAIFKESPLKYISGTCTNDANHISGPSRTGEGLFRSVKKTLKNSRLSVSDIDFISAHGTATLYNDEMESIAFGRLDLTGVPANSLKAYYGHTLGAAGVLETAISMQGLRNSMLVKSKGFEDTGTSVELNIIQEHKKKDMDVFLKTSSGFGGCNATLMIGKV